MATRTFYMRSRGKNPKGAGLGVSLYPQVWVRV
jgi:hypothetical protein